MTAERCEKHSGKSSAGEGMHSYCRPYGRNDQPCQTEDYFSASAKHAVLHTTQCCTQHTQMHTYHYPLAPCFSSTAAHGDSDAP